MSEPDRVDERKNGRWQCACCGAAGSPLDHECEEAARGEARDRAAGFVCELTGRYDPALVQLVYGATSPEDTRDRLAEAARPIEERQAEAEQRTQEWEAEKRERYAAERRKQDARFEREFARARDPWQAFVAATEPAPRVIGRIGTVHRGSTRQGRPSAPRRRGSRRATGTGSRAGPSSDDDPSDSEHVGRHRHRGCGR